MCCYFELLFVLTALGKVSRLTNFSFNDILKMLCGAIAEGQLSVLRSLGITAESIGCPIRAQHRCILSLTPETHGNGYGMGAADAITKRMFDQLDLEQIYPNSITSTSLGFSKIPIIMPSDKAAIALCIRTCNKIDKTAPRIIRIRNTLALGELEVSEACLPDIKENMQIESEPYDLPFNADGNLL